MFSQALMYYAHRHFENGWAGEPESDPTTETAAPEGVEMTPSRVLQLAYNDLLADESVKAGEICHPRSSGSSSRQGSSTGCLLTLNASSGMLRTAKYVRFYLLVDG